MLTTDLRGAFDENFRGYRDQLRGSFNAHSVTRPGRDDKPEQYWDLVALYQDNGLDDALSAYFDTVGDLADYAEEQMEQAFDEALTDGNRRELWLLSMGGLPGEDYANSLPPDPERRRELLLLAGIAGLSWLDRLQRWEGETRQQGERWLRASVTGGRSFGDTVQGLDAIATTYTNRVTGLASDELYRAYGQGIETAAQAVATDHNLLHIWVTRQDRLVCPICAALNMTVTTLLPVTDSHPGCRCFIVPVPEHYTPREVDYEDFVQSLIDSGEFDDAEGEFE